MVRIVLAGAGHVRGNDMYFFAAQAPVHLVEPDCSAALGRQEELGQNEIAIVRRRHVKTVTGCAVASASSRLCMLRRLHRQSM